MKFKNPEAPSQIKDFKLSSGQRKGLWGFLAFICLIRVLLLIQLPFTDTTEARYAEIARKMVETNDWITPQFEYGVPFWGKPPLHTWVSALGMEVFGVGEFGARIFIFFVSLGTLWMLYGWAKSFKGGDYALLGVSTLASSALFYLASATVMTDMVMAAGVFLSMAGFYSALHAERYTRLWGYLFFVGLAIGMLAKGPVAVVLTAIPIGAWVLLKNQWVATWRRLPWVEGILLGFCIFLPWYVAAEIKTPGFLEYFIVGEHLQRFLQSGWEGDLYGNGHAEAHGMIWAFWFAAVLPWGFFFLAPLRWGKSLYSAVKSEETGWSLYLICWALSPMLFFTMATNILATYVITGLPAACFLAIDLWKYICASDRFSWRGVTIFFTTSASLAALSFALVYGALCVAGPKVVHKSQKYVVDQVNALRGSNSGEIFYYHKRFYSAEFYANGQVHVVDTDEELNSMLHNQTRDFLVVRKKDMDRFPQTMRSHFELEGYYGREALFYEL